MAHDRVIAQNRTLGLTHVVDAQSQQAPQQQQPQPQPQPQPTGPVIGFLGREDAGVLVKAHEASLAGLAEGGIDYMVIRVDPEKVTAVSK